MRFGLHQGDALAFEGESAQAPKPCRRRLAPDGIDAHQPLTTAQDVLFQGRIDQHFRVRQFADDQRQIAFLHPAFANQLVQFAQGAAPLADHQTTGGLAIETVDQFQLVPRTQLTQ